MVKMMVILLCAYVLFVCDAKYLKQSEESVLMDTIEMMLKDPEFISLAYKQQYRILMELYKVVEMHSNSLRENTKD